MLWARDNYSSVPGGFQTIDPTTIEPDDVADAGDPDEGWAAASHVHAIVTAAPTDLGNANAEGSGTSFPRSDHVHKRSVRVKGAGSDVGTRNALDFRTGLTTADDSGNDEVDVSVTGAPAAKGSLWSHNGTTQASLAVGSNGLPLMALSTEATGLKWGPIIVSPAQITGNQNDYAPGVANILRLTSDASRNITGMVAQASGLVCLLFNVGTQDIVLQHQNASSAEANRFICPGAADLTLSGDEAALLVYDGTTARWRMREL